MDGVKRRGPTLEGTRGWYRERLRVALAQSHPAGTLTGLHSLNELIEIALQHGLSSRAEREASMGHHSAENAPPEEGQTTS